MLNIHGNIGVVKAILAISQRASTAEKSKELVAMVDPYVWKSRDLKTILGACSPFAINDFALGPNALGPMIDFALEYHTFISQAVITTGLTEATRLAECGRLDDLFKTIHLRTTELVSNLTVGNDRDQIDPPGFRDAVHALKTKGPKFPVSAFLITRCHSLNYYFY